MPSCSCSGDEEDKAFFAATPAGNCTMTIKNEVAAANFKPGDEFYVDFIPVEKAE